LRENGVHAWLAFLAGVLVVFGAFLIFSADLGVVYYGLAVQVEAVIAVISLVFGAVFAYLFWVGVKAQQKTIKTGKEALIGAKGIVTMAFSPKGEVRVSGEFWQAYAKDCSELLVDQDVEVLALDGMFLVVKAV
jgi:membrane-bound serine protease (ClpP class)